MTLDTGEFIRRFLIHVLPKGFHRIRHYGLLASGSRADNLATMRILIAMAAPASARKQASKADAPAVTPPVRLCACCAPACSSLKPSRDAAGGADLRQRGSGSTRHETSCVNHLQ